MAAKTGEAWKKTPGKTRNLSEKQVKQGQRAVGGGQTERLKKGEGAAAMKSVDIGQTKWMTKSDRGGAGRGGLLVDSSGKAVTGTVKLPSGAMASYVRGKRVTTMPKASGGGGGGSRGGGGGGGGGGSKPTSPMAPKTSGGTREQPGGSSGKAKYAPPMKRVSPSKRGEDSPNVGRGSTRARSFGGNLPGDRQMKSGETWSYTDTNNRKRNFRMRYGTTLLTRKNYAGPEEWA